MRLQKQPTPVYSANSHWSLKSQHQIVIIKITASVTASLMTIDAVTLNFSVNLHGKPVSVVFSFEVLV
jgi:hypothetical protein